LKVFLDRRETRDPRILWLLKRYAEVEVTELPLGDIATTHCIVERKSFSDYVSSLVDGRLFDQARRMFDSGKASFIVVHDHYEVTRGVTDKQIFGSMAALVVENGVPILWVPPVDKALYCAVKLCEKVEQGKLLKPRHLRKPKRSKAPWCVRKLSQFLEVPEKVAARLLAKYGSVSEIAKADLNDLRSIEGIGYLRATRIQTLLTKDWRRK